MFYIGQEVVCIDDEWNAPPWELDWRQEGIIVPIKGCIYTIRGFPVSKPFPHITWMVFEEVVNEVRGSIEPSFNSVCFRPLERRSSSEKIVRGLLTPTRQKEDA